MKKYIHLITQPPEELGCGIACVSMITGSPYEKLKQDLSKHKGWSKRKRKYRTHYEDLTFLLKNTNHEVVKYDSMEGITNPSIIGVNNEQNKYHWVLAFRKNSELYIADPETGELYKHNNWKDDYSLYVKNRCIVFPDLIISNVAI